MFDHRRYIKKLEELREEMMLSRTELAARIGIDYKTLRNFLTDSSWKFRPFVLRKIKEFVDEYKDEE